MRLRVHEWGDAGAATAACLLGRVRADRGRGGEVPESSQFGLTRV